MSVARVVTTYPEPHKEEFRHISVGSWFRLSPDADPLLRIKDRGEFNVVTIQGELTTVPILERVIPLEATLTVSPMYNDWRDE